MFSPNGRPPRCQKDQRSPGTFTRGHRSEVTDQTSGSGCAGSRGRQTACPVPAGYFLLPRHEDQPPTAHTPTQACCCVWIPDRGGTITEASTDPSGLHLRKIGERRNLPSLSKGFCDDQNSQPKLNYARSLVAMPHLRHTILCRSKENMAGCQGLFLMG